MVKTNASIVIQCKKNGELLVQCIEKSLDIEGSPLVIVVTESPFEELKAKFDPSRVEWYLARPNTNMSTKRNFGVEKAKTEYIAFIDSDAYPDHDWLTNGIYELELNLKTGAVGGPELSFPNETWDEKTVGIVSQSFFIMGVNSFKRKVVSRRPISHLSGCNLIIKKSVYIKVNGMDEDLYLSEDYDFSKKLRSDLDVELIYSPKVRVFHKNRGFKGFIIQRLARGIAAQGIVISHLKSLFFGEEIVDRSFRWELLIVFLSGFIGIIMFLFLLFGIYPELILTIVSLNLILFLFEAFRLNGIKPSTFMVWIFLIIGVAAPGISAFLESLWIKINIKNLYRNNNDK